MTIFSLKQRPDLLQNTLHLVEEAFHYEESHSFNEDFAPLMCEENYENIFLKVNNDNKVIAHIACKKKNINNHPFIMLGGIAVDPQTRGEGHFQELMSYVLTEKKDEAAVFLLWSDQEKLYRKFGFYLCGQQFEQAEKISANNNFIKTKFSQISSSEKKEIESIFKNSFQKTYLTFERNQQDWKIIEKIKSADLYIRKKENLIHDYFFMNKGQDLNGIIYEYGTRSELKSFIAELAAFGKVWTAFPLNDSDSLQFQFMACPGDKKLFSQFVTELSQGKITINEINSIKQEIYFYFGDELLALDIEELLKGLLGPGIFEEIPDIQKIFISGLDSV